MVGWIKRGPSGVIGTNKADAVETVDLMLADAAEGKTLQPTVASDEARLALIQERQPDYFSYADWQTLDKLETEAGAAQGRPRLKFSTIADMVAAVKGK